MMLKQSFSALTVWCLLTLVAAKKKCPQVRPLKDLDLQEYVRASWYSQQQQTTPYQKKKDLFCVVATYDDTGEFSSDGDEYSVPFFSGKVFGVLNYKNADEVNGEPTQNDPFCARVIKQARPGALAVAPCNRPNQLAGPYWVIAVGEATDGTYEWAVVSGGQPTEKFSDGCTTVDDENYSGGLWILSREPVLSPEGLTAARQALTDKGYTLSRLRDVEQRGCEYNGAIIKN